MSSKNDTDYKGKWVLINSHNNKVIYSSDDITKVIEKGNEHPLNDVVIEKKLVKGTCFF